MTDAEVRVGQVWRKKQRDSHTDRWGIDWMVVEVRSQDAIDLDAVRTGYPWSTSANYLRETCDLVEAAPE